jgi:hypothetical protein
LKLRLINIDEQLGVLRKIGKTTPEEIKANAVKYLKSGLTIAACPGLAKDDFNEKKVTIPITPLTQTDGEWTWSSLLIYYLENYSIPLPDDFISHMVNNSWVVDKEKAKAKFTLTDISE